MFHGVVKDALRRPPVVEHRYRVGVGETARQLDLSFEARVRPLAGRLIRMQELHRRWAAEHGVACQEYRSHRPVADDGVHGPVRVGDFEFESDDGSGVLVVRLDRFGEEVSHGLLGATSVTPTHATEAGEGGVILSGGFGESSRFLGETCSKHCGYVARLDAGGSVEWSTTFVRGEIREMTPAILGGTSVLGAGAVLNEHEDFGVAATTSASGPIILTDIANFGNCEYTARIR